MAFRRRTLASLRLCVKQKLKSNQAEQRMSGIPDTLIEICAEALEAEEIAQAERDICSLYPPEAAKPNFRLTDVVERGGKKFVRLSTMAGSLHLWLRRGVKLRAFPRPILSWRDIDDEEYEYLS
jgi:hypothetical protein